MNVAVVAVVPVTVALFPPIVTVAPERFVPVIVTDCPPAAGPLVGFKFVIVGAATYVIAARGRRRSARRRDRHVHRTGGVCWVVNVAVVAVVPVTVAALPPIVTVAPLKHGKVDDLAGLTGDTGGATDGEDILLRKRRVSGKSTVGQRERILPRSGRWCL